MSNKDVFVKFVPSTAESIDKHLHRMQERGTWATLLKIIASASLLLIPIYIATQRSQTMEYYWEMHNPQSCSSSIQHCSLKEHSLRHIKLAHVSRCHYETVKINDGSLPKHSPSPHSLPVYFVYFILDVHPTFMS